VKGPTLLTIRRRVADWRVLCRCAPIPQFERLPLNAGFVVVADRKHLLSGEKATDHASFLPRTLRVASLRDICQIAEAANAPS